MAMDSGHHPSQLAWSEVTPGLAARSPARGARSRWLPDAVPGELVDDEAHESGLTRPNLVLSRYISKGSMAAKLDDLQRVADAAGPEGVPDGSILLFSSPVITAQL